MSKSESKIEVKRDASEPVANERESWGPIQSLRDEIDRLFEDFGGEFWDRPRRILTRLPKAEWRPAPAMELVDCNGEYRLTAELPGMAAEDINIKLTDGMITIRGEKSEEKKEEKDNYLLSERRYGSFHRALPLPRGIDPDAVSASFANGLLTMTFPKTPEAKQKERNVEVKAA